MTGEDQPKKKKRGLLRNAFSIAFFSLLAYIVISLISGNGLGFDWLPGLFSTGESVELSDEFHFNIGRSRVFADLDNALAASGSLGIQVLDYAGSETLRDSFQMNAPAISSDNGRAIAFDIGGTAARVFDANEIIASITTGGPIISASINRSGWFTISAQEGGGYRGIVSVYNSSGSMVYRVSLSSGYVLSAQLSPDNRSLAVLNLTDGGSRITFYHGLDKDYADAAFDLPGGLIVDAQYLSNGDMLAVTADSLITIDAGRGSGAEIFGFSGMRLGGYAISGDFIALHLLDFGIGHRGRLLTLDSFGNLFGEVMIERELISMSLRDGHISAMFSDGLFIYDRSLKEIPLSDESPSAAGVSRVLILNGGATLVAGDRFAVVAGIGAHP